MTNNQNFVEFMNGVVIPAQNASPDHIRLDGNTSGGNRTVFGCFQHYGRTWKVHSDTHYEPLILAYEATINDDSDPFVEDNTERGGSSLILRSELRELQNSSYKHLYIYEI
jgi:hypothetical protein